MKVKAIKSMVICCKLLFFGTNVIASYDSVTSSINDSVYVAFQDRVLAGQVKDAKGNPLQGATVQPKLDASRGTTTDQNGRFTINLTSSDTSILIRSVGYIAQEIPLREGFMEITLEEERGSLDEVVVVGYGTQKKESVTGAISTVGSKDLARSVATTTSGALVGKIAGVNSRMPDGRPGASTNINIRNMGNPLYVIDGVQKDAGQFNNLDFNDIESVSVLKDASAAIYGVRAANGVVVVTTKKGKRGDQNDFTINSYYGWQNMFRFPRPASATTYIKSYIQSDAILGVQDPQFSLTDLAKWEEGTEKGYRPFDWYDYILQTSPQTYISGAASGGSEKINYYLSAGHLDQKSIIRNYGGFNRTNVQMNLDANVSSKLKIGGNLNGRIEQRRQPGVPGQDDTWQALFGIYRNLPTARPFANDNPLYPARTAANTETNFGMLNYDLSGEYQEKWRVMQLNFNAEYAFSENLKLRGLVGYYLANKWMDNQEFTYKLYGYDEATDSYPVVFSMDNPWRERDIRMVEELSYQTTLNYTKSFGKSNVSTLLAAEAITRDEPGFWIHDRPASNRLSLLYFQTIDQFNDTGINTQARAGFAARVNYDFDNKYLLELAGRYDGSWKFPPGSRWGFFPSVSAGWRIAQEDFVKDSFIGNVFQDLKLRASYGVLGDDNLDDWQYYAFGFLPGYTYNQGGATINGDYVVGAQPRGLPVTTLSWIRANSFDVGLDFTLLGGKLTGTVDYFNRKRTDLPASRYDILIPAEAGFSLPYENLNSDMHRGFDGGITWRSQVGKVNYFVGGNFTYARQLDGQQYRPRFGNVLDEYRNTITNRYAFLNWGLHAVGQFQNWEEIKNYNIDNDGQGNTTLRPGDIKYDDVNGDGIINALDQRPIGYRQGGLPYLNFALNLGVQYKGFDVAMDLTGASFASYRANYEGMLPFHDGGNNAAYYMENQWMLSDITDPNSELIPGKFPTLIRGNQNHSNYWHSDFWLMNITYLKLRNLQVGYSLPNQLTERWGIKNLRLYSMMQNLFSIDNLGDMEIDPELTADSGIQYPTNRVINVGLTVTF
ncbi:SusC/RagA family TonB-linked outer membrane protein [Sphingobacterium deserti]|uniref:TonB-dependent receptor n=1 Tax=Sphingobacterium deserti TaxID=1229276 RepID=A0A0B8T1R3_9SPHI|nr:TonB-dependent receptor [Sphingobacterium deserti]KGE15082.1 TonB-dependent receptor [Sphingobacterium deserti]